MKTKFSEESINFIKDHISDDPAELMLHSRKYYDLPMKDIVIQIASRQKAKDKLPEWAKNYELIFPAKENLEQASSELTARFKARFLKGETFVDLTGGSGIDTYYISENFEENTYVEPNPELREIAEYNYKILSRNVEIRQQKAEEFLSTSSKKWDWIFIDPSRRDENHNKVYALDDCVPNVIEMESQLLSSSGNVLIKASPMLDIKKTLEQFSSCYKIQVLAVDSEVKELLIYLNADFSGEAEIEAWNISDKREEEVFTFKYSEEELCNLKIGTPQTYLFEPNASLMKAGAFKLISSAFGMSKLHPNTHIYTSNDLVEHFPGKKLEILEVFKPSKKEIRKRIQDGLANIIVRNYPMGANEIKKKFGLKDGGDIFLVFCEIEESGLKAILCKRSDSI